jgi:hypothetical protein
MCRLFPFVATADWERAHKSNLAPCQSIKHTHSTPPTVSAVLGSFNFRHHSLSGSRRVDPHTHRTAYIYYSIYKLRTHRRSSAGAEQQMRKVGRAQRQMNCVRRRWRAADIKYIYVPSLTLAEPPRPQRWIQHLWLQINKALAALM